MCLVTKEMFVKRLKEDLVVCKVVYLKDDKYAAMRKETRVYSIFQDYLYVLNTLYSMNPFTNKPILKFKHKRKNGIRFNENLFLRILNYFFKKCNIINEGYHSYSNMDSAKRHKGEDNFYRIDKETQQIVIVECVIPKGSRHVKGLDNEIVSDQIIIKSILNV